MSTKLWADPGVLRRVEHGELTMHTKTGAKVVDVQRGVVTAVNTSQTLLSTMTSTTPRDGTTTGGQSRVCPSLPGPAPPPPPGAAAAHHGLAADLRSHR